MCVCDYVHETLAAWDGTSLLFESPFSVGDPVMLKHSACQQKCVPPFECGWIVKNFFSPATAVIKHANDQHRSKVGNVELLKSDPDPFQLLGEAEEAVHEAGFKNEQDDYYLHVQLTVEEV